MRIPSPRLPFLLIPILLAGAASAELREGELAPGASPVLQNGSGTVRLEQSRLGGIGVRAIPLPEPGALWQLVPGLGLLALLHRRRRRLAGVGLALGVALLCGFGSLEARAQVPQDVTYTGRLVDNLGDPLSGPVNLELRILDAAVGGTQLYSEEHNGVALTATGAFAVQLGMGASPVGTFDADLFSAVNRWLEVVVDTEVLAPRQVVASVPWALTAERANALVLDPAAPRFEDCGDGSVADHQTGLLWEQKTGTYTGSGGLIACDAGFPDVHHVNNAYSSSATDLLRRLNGGVANTAVSDAQAMGDPEDDPTSCFLQYCDWRVPSIGELRTILIGPDAAPGQAATCPLSPCIDADFAAVGGSTASTFHWTRSHYTTGGVSWQASFGNGTIGASVQSLSFVVRAVRPGSCIR